MSSNKENAKEKVEGEKVAIEKAAAADNKEEEKTDLVSDEIWKIEKVQIIDFDILIGIRRIFPFYRTDTENLFHQFAILMFFAVGRR